MEKDMKIMLLTTCIRDFQKSNITPFDRARIIKEYMDTNNLTLSAFSKEMSIPKTTVHGWLSYLNITEEKYDELQDLGFSKTDIHNHLKNKTHLDISEYHDNNLIEARIKLRHCIKGNFKDSPLLVLQELRNIINRIELHYERNRKNEK